jgi:DUF2934 family protein
MHIMRRSKTVQRSSWKADHQAHDDGQTRSDAQQRLGEEFYVQVARKAYELFERRGGEHGHDVDDWLEAERLVAEEMRQGLRQDRP